MGTLDVYVQERFAPSPKATLEDGLDLLHAAYAGDPGVKVVDQSKYHQGLEKVKLALEANPSLTQAVLAEYEVAGKWGEGRLYLYRSDSSVKELIVHCQFLTDMEKIGVEYIISPEALAYSSISKYGVEGLKLLKEKFNLELDSARIAVAAYRSISDDFASYRKVFDALEYAHQMGRGICLDSLLPREKLEEFFKNSLDNKEGNKHEYLHGESEVLKYLLILKSWGLELVSDETMSILKARAATESTPPPPTVKAKKPLWKRISDGILDAINDEGFP